MSNTKPVTGGPLYHLWWVANRALTSVENIYIDMTETHAKTLSSGDSGTYGECWEDWHELQDLMHRVLFNTGLSLSRSSKALNMAIDDFKYVDEDTSGKLTQAGKDLETTLGNPNQHDPEVELDGRLVPPKDPIDEINQHFNGPTIPVGNLPDNSEDD